MGGFMSCAELDTLWREAELRSRDEGKDASSSDSSVNSYLQVGGDITFLDQGLPEPRAGEDELVGADLLLFDRSEDACFSDAMELSDCEFQENAFGVDNFLVQDLPPPGLGGEIHMPIDPILDNAKNFVVDLPALVGVENHMEVDPLLQNPKDFVWGVPSVAGDENYVLVDTTDLQNAMEELQIEDMVQVKTAGRRWPVLAPSKSIGITQRRHGTWEAHIWLKDFNLDREKNGMQCFVGSFSTKEDAKKAYDKVAIKLDVRLKKDGTPRSLNFPEEQYADYIAEQTHSSRRDYLWKIRRDSEKFSTGDCELKGVRLQKNRGVWSGRYTATISLTPKSNSTKTDKCAKGKSSLIYKIKKKKKKNNKKSMTLGSFDTEEEAGREYDKALLFIQGMYSGCITNFQPGRYLESEVLEVGRKLTKAHPNINFKEHETALECLL